MSIKGGGGVVLLPLVAGVVLAAGLLVAAGAVVYQLGKGILACGQWMVNAIQHHLKKHQENFERVKAVEEEFQRKTSPKREKTSSRKPILSSRIGAMRQIRESMDQSASTDDLSNAHTLPEPPDSVLPVLRDYTERPQETMANNDLVTKPLEELHKYTEALQTRLEELNKNWIGLVDAGDLRREFERLRDDLNHWRSENPPSDSALFDLRLGLNDLGERLRHRMEQGRDRIKDQQRVSDKMQEVWSAFDQLDGSTVDPFFMSRLTGALEEMESSFQSADLSATESAAETARLWIGKIKDPSLSTTDNRRENLLAGISGDQEFLNKLELDQEGVPDNLRALAGQFQQGLQAARTHLDENDFVNCLKQLEALNKQKQPLAEAVILHNQDVQQKGLVAQIGDVLTDLGYEINNATVVNGNHRIEAEKKDESAMWVTIDAQARLEFKIDVNNESGLYDNLRCKEETARFVEKLREKNIIGNFKKGQSLARTAEELARAMTTRGLSVRVEKNPQGGLRLIGLRDSQIKEQHDVDHQEPQESKSQPPGKKNRGAQSLQTKVKQ